MFLGIFAPARCRTPDTVLTTVSNEDPDPHRGGAMIIARDSCCVYICKALRHVALPPRDKVGEVQLRLACCTWQLLRIHVQVIGGA